VALEARAANEISAGDYDRAAATLERAIRIDPRDPTLWVALGEVRLAQGRPDLAESLAIKAESLAGANQIAREEAQQLATKARAAR
jgi:Flp pilus assembly protein TadD